jgi:biotin-(acetyl-CoA carboxylase) ligase
VAGSTGRVEGELSGIDEDGSLLVRSPDGTPQRLSFGESLHTLSA